MKWVIYVLKNPRTQAVRYVGTTTQQIEQRLRQHIAEAVRFRRTRKERGIFSMRSIGLEPLIEAIDSGVGDGWAEAECRWIASYRAAGADLWNATEGGEGVFGELARTYAKQRWAKRTPEQRSEISKKIRAHELPGQRSAWMKKARESQTSEELSANGKRGIAVSSANRTPEERSAMITKANKTRWARMTREERSATVIKRQAAYAGERRRIAGLIGKAGMTPEQRSAAAKKAYETRRGRQSPSPSQSPDNQL